MLLLSDKFLQLCHGAILYLDTNVFICAEENDKLVELIADLTNTHNTAFVTLQSVEYEFSRGSRSLSEITLRREFVRSLVHTVMSVNPLLDGDRNATFSVAMSLVVGRGNSQYTDFLLAAALHAYDNNIERHFVLSADVKAFPADLCDIEGVVTLNRKNGDIGHLHLISLDQGRYSKILRTLEG